MPTSLLTFSERARKNETVIRSALADTGQLVAADLMGLSESTVSRMKGRDDNGGEIEQISRLMAAIGLKPVPINMHCKSDDEWFALQVLASRSHILDRDTDVGQRCASDLRWD
jgi:hypothetical protein